MEINQETTGPHSDGPDSSGTNVGLAGARRWAILKGLTSYAFWHLELLMFYLEVTRISRFWEMIFSIVSPEGLNSRRSLLNTTRICAHGREQRDNLSDRQAQNLTPGQEREGGPNDHVNHSAVVCRDFLGSGRRLEDSKDLWGGWFAAPQAVENHFRSSSAGLSPQPGPRFL